MNPSTREHFERLIVRKLDGEITACELAELDRAVLGDPEVRELHDDLERIDALSARVLQASVGAGRLPVRVDRHHPMRPGHRVWSLVPGALAASLVIVTLLSSLQRPPAPTGDDVGPTIQVAGFPGAAAAFAAPRPAPALVDRHADTDLIGIRGADGNIYFIEIDRIRTLSRPSRGSGVRLAGYDM